MTVNNGGDMFKDIGDLKAAKQESRLSQGSMKQELDVRASPDYVPELSETYTQAKTICFVCCALWVPIALLVFGVMEISLETFITSLILTFFTAVNLLLLNFQARPWRLYTIYITIYGCTAGILILLLTFSHEKFHFQGNPVMPVLSFIQLELVGMSAAWMVFLWKTGKDLDQEDVKKMHAARDKKAERDAEALKDAKENGIM